MADEMNQYYHDDIFSSLFSYNNFEATQALSPLMSFNDLFNSSLVDYNVLNGTPDLPMASVTKLEDKVDDIERNFPTLSNSSASFSSTEVGIAVDEDSSECKKDHQEEEISDESKKVNKPRKKGEKRQREAAFAFMTRSDVDNLGDGYRWRKYGQKAVKNSPYPRSYYRCTSQKCSVKKRVERSHLDPTIVITTYEGQHTHQSPETLRRSTRLFAPPTMFMMNFGQDLLMHQLSPLLQSNTVHQFHSANPNQSPAIQGYDILQDIFPSSFMNGSS